MHLVQASKDRFCLPESRKLALELDQRCKSIRENLSVCLIFTVILCQPSPLERASKMYLLLTRANVQNDCFC